ncbi:MAG: insulinase family protein [Pyrinomonadaceae bacterium]|nr:insulinase family protein [Pyrinomonadaceae bacterium]
MNLKDTIKTTRFENGLTVITETMPDVRSATLGFWVKLGSRSESPELNGICHFIEHAVFKGTSRRSALDIAIESDKLGGNLNAFTSHEETGFIVKVVDDRIEQAFDLIADMLTAPRFEEKEMRRERGVIIEEIKMVEDSPEDLLTELFLSKVFPGHPLGRPIEGTKKTVRSFTGEKAAAFHSANYSSGNILIACAGNVDHDRIASLAERSFPASRNGLKKNGLQKSEQKPVLATPIVLSKKRNLEQTHLIIASPWIAAGDKKRYAASLLISILGDGNSSRLWQNIREKHGLAYSVGANSDSFSDCGIFSIYAGTSPENLGEVIDLSIGEIKKIKRSGVSTDELSLVKEQTIASVLLSLESSASRVETLAHNEIVHGRQIPVEETIAKLEAVSTDDVTAVANEFFQTENISLAALGNLNGIKVDRDRLNVS